jgi:hypothetical protein
MKPSVPLSNPQQQDSCPVGVETDRPGHALPSGVRSVRRSGPANRFYVTPVNARLFYRLHPECELTEERLELLSRLIHDKSVELARRARMLSTDMIEDFRQAIIEGIVMNGMSYTLGPDGEHVFDFFAQEPGYIVQRGAQRAEQLQRQQTEFAKHTTAAIRINDDEEEENLFDTIASDTTANSDSLLFAELVKDIMDELTPTQRKAVRLLVEGVDRRDISRKLGVSRQSAHLLLERIAIRTRAMLDQRGDEEWRSYQPRHHVASSSTSNELI